MIWSDRDRHAPAARRTGLWPRRRPAPGAAPAVPSPLRTAAAVCLLAAAALPAAGGPAGAETWHGLTVAPEHRCTPYDRDDYRYPQSVESVVIARMGGRIYGPYTGRTFSSKRQTDIEHIVAVSEAHDSGLCAAGAAIRRSFARDPLNLTLAAPEVNRCGRGGKCAHDAAGWLPEYNRCWFADRIRSVKLKYGLTVDRREAAALDRVLAGCTSTAMLIYSDAGSSQQSGHAAPATADPDADALALWDDNGNGRITCKEARRHGIAPVPRGHPAYVFMRDGDGDGMVCE